jgi:hypothetical protein
MGSQARNRSDIKTYAMHRMVVALGRAIAAPRTAEKVQASRWASAWGASAGIRGKGIRLKQDRRVMMNEVIERRRKPR